MGGLWFGALLHHQNSWSCNVPLQVESGPDRLGGADPCRKGYYLHISNNFRIVCIAILAFERWFEVVDVDFVSCDHSSADCVGSELYNHIFGVQIDSSCDIEYGW